MLQNYSCDPEDLEKMFNTDPKFDFDPIPIDGILFYHKKAHYFPGVTPLVRWLKGYMLPEMLKVQVRNPNIDWNAKCVLPLLFIILPLHVKDVYVVQVLKQVLNFQVSKKLMNQRPSDYITMTVFINEFDERHREIKRYKKLKIEQKRSDKSTKNVIRINSDELEEITRLTSQN